MKSQPGSRCVERDSRVAALTATARERFRIMEALVNVCGMRFKNLHFALFFASALLALACNREDSGSRTISGALVAGTETGNTKPAPKALVSRTLKDDVCALLVLCKNVDAGECSRGVDQLTGMDARLGLPAMTYNNYSQLINSLWFPPSTSS